jgi:ADP-ribose pyrophosphatase
MNILDHASYSASDVTIESREFLFRGFIQVEKVNLTHRLFHRSEYSPLFSVNLYIVQKLLAFYFITISNNVCLIEQFRVGALNDPVSMAT